VLPRIARAAAAPDPSSTPAPAAPAPALRVIVLGDPRGDLPASAAETARLGARLGVEPHIRADATRAIFAAARGADLLHVSAHTKVDGGGTALMLADGPIAPVDIARLAPAPRLVVLASCSGSAGIDDAGSGSLAHAFLDAGAEHVVATKWTIRDADAARLIAAFYEAGGDRDPVQGLAAAQLKLAGALETRTWASFEVFAARPAVR
jgi:CHAT domain-containing protein